MRDVLEGANVQIAGKDKTAPDGPTPVELASAAAEDLLASIGKLAADKALSEYRKRVTNDDMTYAISPAAPPAKEPAAPDQTTDPVEEKKLAGSRTATALAVANRRLIKHGLPPELLGRAPHHGKTRNDTRAPRVREDDLG